MNSKPYCVDCVFHQLSDGGNHHLCNRDGTLDLVTGGYLTTTLLDCREERYNDNPKTCGNCGRFWQSGGYYREDAVKYERTP